jgi:thymidylate synthase ThyX
MKVQIIKDSVSPSGIRLTTFQLRYQRFIHSELMTHRMFSRNASSSRAIPIQKMIDQVRNDPAMPHEWGKNITGMQAKEQLVGEPLSESIGEWARAAMNAADSAEFMMNEGLHKQVANRILEPFQWIHVVLSATEFDNFFALRNHADAQPEIRDLAAEMQRQYNKNKPTLLQVGEWHLPYIREDERHYDIELALKCSTARCCRVSYLKHDGFESTNEEDIQLHDRLIGSKPIHASPTEHQAICTNDIGFNGNFKQWKQYRKQVEHPEYLK